MEFRFSRNVSIAEALQKALMDIADAVPNGNATLLVTIERLAENTPPIDVVEREMNQEKRGE